MPASQVRADYDELKNIAGGFSQEADKVKETIGKLNSLIEELHGGEWIGDGEKKFYSEMQDSVMPAMKHLHSAMQKGSETSTKIADKFGKTEDEVGGLWKIVLSAIQETIGGGR